MYCLLITIGPRSEGVKRVGNNHDQAQLRSIKMADAEHGEFRQSRIVSTRHLVRRPYSAWKESWDRLILDHEKPQHQKIVTAGYGWS